MAREQMRRKTQREQVDLKQQSTELNVTRRYLQAGGYDKNVRAARALEDALGVGTRAYQGHVDRKNEEGRKSALAERGAGQDRRDDEKNAGYNRAWDELDAQFDYLEFESELDKELLEAGAGEWDEAQLQGYLSERMQSQFGGIENLGESAYAQLIAPKLLELETRKIGEHRQQVLEKLQQEKRVKTYTVYKGELVKARSADPSAQLDYAGLFDKTGKFFAGADKKVTFWESIYDIAYDLGDPTVITNVPLFINNIATGNDDPEFLKEQQAAIDRATNEALRRSNAKAAEQEAIDKESYRNLILDASIAAVRGEDISVFVPSLYANPFGSGEDIRALDSTRRSSLDELESRSWNPNTVTNSWSLTFDGKLSVQDIRQLHEDGYFGRGPQSTQLAEDMMRAADQVRARMEKDSDGSWSQWNGQLDRDFPKSGGGKIDTIDPKMGPINADAKRLYIELTTGPEAIPARDAYMRVRDQFDPVVERVKPGFNQKSPRAASAALGMSYTPDEVEAFTAGKMSAGEFLGPRSIDEAIIQLGNMSLSDEKLNELALLLTQ